MKKLVLLFSCILLIASCGKDSSVTEPQQNNYNVNGWMLFTLPGAKDNTTGYQFNKLYAVNLATGEKKYLFDSVTTVANIVKDKIVFFKAKPVQIGGTKVIAMYLYKANPTGENLQLVVSEPYYYNNTPFEGFLISRNSEWVAILNGLSIDVINISNGTIKQVNVGNSNLVYNYGFSNDCSKLYFSYSVNNKMNLIVYDLKTDNSFTVNDDALGCSWSKDDKYFYFTTSVNSINKLNKYNINTRKIESSFNINKLAFETICNNQQSIVYSESIEKSPSFLTTSVWVSKSDGTNLKKITPVDDLNYIVNPCIPYYDNGEVIALRYKSDDYTKLSLISINVNTGAIKTINDNLLK